MLSQLSIENFAIIESLLLRFESGFTVMTGETGAGKSIIVDALQSSLGARLSAAAIRDGAAFAAVEALFDLSGLSDDTQIKILLAELDIDGEDEVILRREVNASGRTTARINGRAVPAGLISTVGSLMVDIHGQSEHLSILRRDRQLDVLDRYGNLMSQRAETAAAMKRAKHLSRQLEALRAGRREDEQKLDLLRFQVSEIESAELMPDEEETLAKERVRLVNAERFARLAASAYEALQVETGAMGGLETARMATRELTAIDPSFEPLHQRLEASRYEVEDIAQELRSSIDLPDFDPRRLGAIEERLDTLSRLKSKYGKSIVEVIAFGEHARAQMADREDLDAREAELEGQANAAMKEAADLAANLSISRERAASALTANMSPALHGLGLAGTQFEVEVTRTPSQEGVEMPHMEGRFSNRTAGLDTVAFLVSFNPGEPLRPLEKVASGGETSRFLLALKSVLASADETPTLVFDEVDVGVGSRAGVAVGERLRQLSYDHQVISITHLPQIAALADHHLTVGKEISQGRTTVAVRAIESTDRVNEIEQMMSGTGTETARRTAAELLEAAKHPAR